MTRNQTRILSILAAVAIACVTSQGLSYARSAPADIGRARFFEDFGCFTLYGGAMINTCSSAKRLEMPLITDAPGNYTVWVNAQGATASNNVGCLAAGTNDGNTLYWGSAQQWLPAFGAAQTITLSTYIPSFGRLYAVCDVSPNGRVNTVNWLNQ
jgi:hypothetical protein